MKHLIFETNFIHLYYFPQTQELEYLFLEAALTMSDEIYLEELILATDVMENYAIQNIVTDFCYFVTPVVPEIQNRVVTEVVPRWIAMGLKKLALVMPTEFIANLSVDQMSDDAQKITPYTIAYFDNLEAAKRWFYESI